MSIASQLQAYENGLTDAYNMVSQRGGTMPVHKNMSSLASSIATIPSSGINYGIPRTKSDDGVTLSAASSGYTYTPPNGITTIGAKALQYAFYGDENISSADLSAITTLSGSYCLYHAFDSSALASVDLSALTVVGTMFALGYAFKDCTNLTTIAVGARTGFPATTRVFSCGCSGCTSLTTATIYMGSMTQRACQNAFENCTSLTSVSFPVLTSINSTHKNNVMIGMLTGCSNVTVHFPAAMQSVVSTISDLTFGGTNITVSYDL